MLPDASTVATKLIQVPFVIAPGRSRPLGDKRAVVGLDREREIVRRPVPSDIDVADAATTRLANIEDALPVAVVSKRTVPQTSWRRCGEGGHGRVL